MPSATPKLGTACMHGGWPAGRPRLSLELASCHLSQATDLIGNTANKLIKYGVLERRESACILILSVDIRR
jgi:hypothetical protein